VPQGSAFAGQVSPEPVVGEQLRGALAQARGKAFHVLGSSFKDLVIAQISATELRAQVRRRGIVSASPPEKAMVLRRYIADRASGVRLCAHIRQAVDE